MTGAPILIVFGGLPGVGKTTIARRLASEIGAVHVRIDSIEQELRDSGQVTGPMDETGYLIAYDAAERSLCLSRNVIADCVNPLQITRDAWRGIAERCSVEVFEVEIICSDKLEHRRRLESRNNDLPGFHLPTWRDVLARNYEPWNRNHLIIDTANYPVDRAVGEIIRHFSSGCPQSRNPENLKL